MRTEALLLLRNDSLATKLAVAWPVVDPEGPDVEVLQRWSDATGTTDGRVPTLGRALWLNDLCHRTGGLSPEVVTYLQALVRLDLSQLA